jgi:hypothetical protein
VTFPVALAEATEEAPETMPSGRINGGGGDGIREIMDNEDYPVLKPKGEKCAFNDELDFVWISGMGYVDGMLHIQIQWAESVDNHGYIYLLGDDGKVQPYATLNFNLDGVKYSEEVFDIPPEELQKYTLAGYFVREGCYVEGDWNVSFEVKAVDSARITAENLDINGLLLIHCRSHPWAQISRESLLIFQIFWWRSLTRMAQRCPATLCWHIRAYPMQPMKRASSP